MLVITVLLHLLTAASVYAEPTSIDFPERKIRRRGTQSASLSVDQVPGNLDRSIHVMSQGSFRCQPPAPEPAAPSDFSVDVVYTWIKQPSSEEWKHVVKDCPHLQGGWQRMRNMGTFRFSFQMLEQHLPWVRKVFIVTPGGEVPDWLETNNSKVHVINQETLWPPGRLLRDLPIHNSQSVEVYLHRIPDLMPHFVYFNDDMFVGRPLPRSFFFTDFGAPVMHAGKMPRDMNWCNSANPGALEMNDFTHSYMSFTIPTIQAVQKRWPAFFDRMSAAHCRGGDVNGPTWAYAWYGVHSGVTKQSTFTPRMAWMNAGTKDRAAWYKEQLENPPHIACINDDFDVDDYHFAAELKELTDFMHKFAKPVKSAFIKPGH